MDMKGEVRERTQSAIIANMARREKDLRAVALSRHEQRRAHHEQMQMQMQSQEGHGMLRDMNKQAQRATEEEMDGLSFEGRKCANETMVLMPFYGVAVGTGHSVVSTRFAYLNLT